MKHAVRGFLLFLLLVLLLPAAYGAEKVCPLAGTNLTITLPVDYSIFTPSFRPDDPGLAYHGLVADELSAYMEENSLCVVAFDRESSDYLMVKTVTGAQANTFADYTEDQRHQFVADVMNSFSQSPNKEFLSRDYHKLSGAAPFYTFKYRDRSDDHDTYTICCYSILGGDAVILTFYSDRIIDDEAETMVESIMATLSLSGENSGKNATTMMVLLLCSLLSLAVAFLPICVYRFAIRTSTVPDRAQAIKIVLIWSAIYFVLIALLDNWILYAPGILPAGFINYRILAGPKRKQWEELPTSCDTCE